MNITSISATTLTTKLQANGLSADKAKLVENDLAAAEKAGASTSGTITATGDTSVRATLDAQIDADVASGKLSKSDAVAVKKTLDGIDGQSGGSASTSQSAPAATAATQTGAASGAKPSGGGGGGDGSSTKTELSETVTISGSTMTTTVTYSDGTSTTTTTTATEADIAKYGKKSDTGGKSDADTAKNYPSTLPPGSLVNEMV